MNHQAEFDPLRHLQQLQTQALQLIQNPASWSGDPGALQFLDTRARRAQLLLQNQLYPALLEAMAGSDAVCIKGMAQAQASAWQLLERLWHQEIRAACGGQAVANAANLLLWQQTYADLIERNQAELLPMAARLLDNNAWELLESACKSL